MPPRAHPSWKTLLFPSEFRGKIVMKTPVLSDVRVRVQALPKKPSAARRGSAEDFHENPPGMGRKRVEMVLNLEGKVPMSQTPRNPDPTLKTKGSRPLLFSSLLFLHEKLIPTPAWRGQPLSKCSLMLIIEICIWQSYILDKAAVCISPVLMDPKTLEQNQKLFMDLVSK